ncbi:MAG TPA: hypothetical protein VFG24_00740 [Nitrosopumilaceae archaeon]|nr:hypothetical protein [Nitrosopumilaceae archaeon]
MYETAMKLGHGIMRNGCSPVTDVTVNGFFLDVISKFGISREDLKKIQPSYYDLIEIYSELKHFGFSTKYYLKQKPSKR